MDNFSDVPFPDFDGTQNCAGTDVNTYYRDDDESKSVNAWAELKAKRVCVDCAFLKPCYDWGLANEEFGVWGRTTEHERRILRRQNGIEIRPLRKKQDDWLTRVTQAGHNGK